MPRKDLPNPGLVSSPEGTWGVGPQGRAVLESVRSLPEVSASLPVQRDDSHPIHARHGGARRWL